MMSPIDLIQWVSERISFLGLIAPAFIFLLMVWFAVIILKGWQSFVDNVKYITANKGRFLFFIILFIIFLWIWNSTIGSLI